MDITLDCYPCFLKQTMNEIKGSRMDGGKSVDTLKKILGKMAELDLHRSPVDVSEIIHAMIIAEGGSNDPYKDQKEISTSKALEMLPWAMEKIRAAHDPLREALLLSIAGNVIDYGAMNQLDLEHTLEAAWNNGLGLDDYGIFKEHLRSSDRAVYLLDNSGEVVFDGLLMEQMRRFNPRLRIEALAKKVPLLNDVTVDDALKAGIGDIEGVVVKGVPREGWIKPEDLEGTTEGTMIIAKGQGNFENLSEEKGFFFLLVVKCPVVGNKMGVEVGSMVLKWNH